MNNSNWQVHENFVFIASAGSEGSGESEYMYFSMEFIRGIRDTCKRVWMGGGGGLEFTIHKNFSPLFISLKFWVIH